MWQKSKCKALKIRKKWQENWLSTSQLLRGSCSSLHHDPVCSTTQEKVNAYVFSNFWSLLSCPILNLGRDWFLLPQSCQEKMRYTLLCRSSLHDPQFHSFFLTESLTGTGSVLGAMAKAKKNQLGSGPPPLPRVSCIVTKHQCIWKAQETGKRSFQAVMLFLETPNGGDAEVNQAG